MATSQLRPEGVEVVFAGGPHERARMKGGGGGAGEEVDQREGSLTLYSSDDKAGHSEVGDIISAFNDAKKIKDVTHNTECLRQTECGKFLFYLPD